MKEEKLPLRYEDTKIHGFKFKTLSKDPIIYDNLIFNEGFKTLYCLVSLYFSGRKKE
jgi:hypothetical protein